MLLVLRLAKLIFGVKIDPKLESERRLIETARHLCVHDAFASCHPLDVTSTDPAAVTFEVLVQNFVLQHVSYRLEATMRMIRKASRQFHIKQVKHQEGVQITKLPAADDSSDFCTITFALLFRFETHLDLLFILHKQI